MDSHGWCFLIQGSYRDFCHHQMIRQLEEQSGSIHFENFFPIFSLVGLGDKLRGTRLAEFEIE